MSDKFEKNQAGPHFYTATGFVRKSVYQHKTKWTPYERAAKRKGWSLTRYMTWFLGKNAPKR